MNLASRLNIAGLPAFDYAALGDEEVERRARAAVLKIRELQKAALVDIGRELLAMKELLPHGQFLPWVESIGISRRSANDYMHVAAEFGSKWATVAHLPHGVIYKLAAPSTPPAVREAVMKIRSDQVVTIENVQSLIDTVKGSEAKKQRAELRRKQKEKYELEREARTAKWEAERAKAAEEHEAEREKARDAAEQVRFMLGGHFPDACKALEGVDFDLFMEEFGTFVRQRWDREMLEQAQAS